MLPIRGQGLAKTLTRSLKNTSHNYGASVIPLTEPLDDHVVKQKANLVRGEVKISQLNNGVQVATIDNGGSVSHLSAAISYGSRHETASKLGLVHVFKNAAFITNKDRTSFRTVREMQQAGVLLESHATREMLLRKAVFLRHKLPEVMENVAPGITQPVFNSWDVEDVKNACRAEYNAVKRDDTAINFEVMHRLAFRTDLGNPLFCHNLRLNNYDVAKFEEFSNEIYVGEKLSVVGYDIAHDDLVRLTQEHFGSLRKGEKTYDLSQKYFGGEGRWYTGNDLTHASLVTQGSGLFHESLPTFMVLSKLLGDDQYIKWGNHQVSRLYKSAASVTGDGPLKICALNMNYSDAGLFGFHAISSPKTIKGVLKSAINALNNISKGDISNEELLRAKNQAKAGVLMSGETKEDFLDDVVKQVVFRSSYEPIQDTVKKVDKVSVEDLTKIAKTMVTLSENGVLSVTGDVSRAPYLDQLQN